MRQPQTPRPPLVGGPPNRGPEAAAIFGEGYPPRRLNSQRGYPSPNSLSGFALGECRPSRKGRAGAEFAAVNQISLKARTSRLRGMGLMVDGAMSGDLMVGLAEGRAPAASLW